MADLESVETQTVRVLIFREGDHWVAQCLDHDIAAQARTIDALFSEFDRIFEATVEVRRRKGLPGVESLPPAPERYWDALKDAVEIQWPEHAGHTTIPRPQGKAVVGALEPAHV